MPKLTGLSRLTETLRKSHRRSLAGSLQDVENGHHCCVEDVEGPKGSKDVQGVEHGGRRSSSVGVRRWKHLYIAC